MSEPARRSVFVPSMLLAVAIVGWFLFQSSQLYAERTALTQAIADQKPQMEQSMVVRERLESTATRGPFGDVARDGQRCASQLIAQYESLVSGQLARRGVDFVRQVDRLFPHSQVLVAGNLKQVPAPVLGASCPWARSSVSGDSRDFVENQRPNREPRTANRALPRVDVHS